MTPEQQLQGTQIALQIAQQMLAEANAKIMDIGARLNMAEAEIVTLKAAQKDELGEKSAANGYG